MISVEEIASVTTLPIQSSIDARESSKNSVDLEESIASVADNLSAEIAVKAQATELLKELTQAFRERQQYGSSGTRSPSGVAVERIKLLAMYINNVGAGLMIVAIVGGISAYFLGYFDTAPANIAILECVGTVVVTSIVLHLAARRVLAKLAS